MTSSAEPLYWRSLRTGEAVEEMEHEVAWRRAWRKGLGADVAADGFCSVAGEVCGGGGGVGLEK